MILRAILCVQHFYSFDAMFVIVNLFIKMDSTVICVLCMLEHVCYEPFSFKIANLENQSCVNWLKFCTVGHVFEYLAPNLVCGRPR